MKTGSAKTIVDGPVLVFNNAFSTTFVPIVKVIPDGTKTLDGTELEVRPDSNGLFASPQGGSKV